jgi:hypothetical protein
MALANFISRSIRLSKPETVAISIECCYQNTAIATSVAVTMFTDPTIRAEAVSVPLFYGFVEAIIIGVYCLWAWKMGWTKAPANEKICVVITKTYELAEDPEEIEYDTADDQHQHPDRRSTWVSQLFVPREQSSSSSTRDVALAPPDKNKPDRDRFYSADVTVATAIATPPGTPDSSLETIPQESARIAEETIQDLEAPSIVRDEHCPAIEVVVQERPVGDHHPQPPQEPDVENPVPQQQEEEKQEVELTNNDNSNNKYVEE